MEATSTNKRVFISHSSQDKEIIDLFVDKILCLGLYINKSDIAYTSREDTGVINGDNIPQYIKTNIANCDIVFFMISDNYKQSNICLNEMGAAWATERCIKIILLPTVSFDSIGWLFSLNKGAKINDCEALDALFDDVTEKLGIKAKISAWNRYKQEFINSLPSNVNLPAVIDKHSLNENEVELGILDHRENFNNHNKALISTINTIKTATEIYTQAIQQRTLEISKFANNPNATAQNKAILKTFAKDMITYANVIDESEPKMKQYFSYIIEDYKNLTNNSSNNNAEVIEDNRNAITQLAEAITKSKNGISDQRRAVAQFQNLESSQIQAQKKLVESLGNLIKTMDYCVTKTSEATAI